MRLPLQNIKYFLQSRGWSLEDTKESTRNLLVYSNERHPKRELILPIREDAPDFNDAAANIVSKLAAIEQKSAESIHREILIAKAEHTPQSFDKLTLRIIKAVEDGESIPLMLAKSAISEVETLIMTASCQAERPAKFYRRINNKLSNTLIEKTTFNHTRYGSFMLSVSCPLLSKGEQLPLGLDKSNLPPARKAFSTLQESISLLHETIAERKHTQLALDIATQENPIISANLIESIANIAASDTGGGIHFGFEWSSLIQAPASKSDRSLIFQKEDANPLYEIVTALRPKEAIESNRFIGTVEVLRGNLAEDGHRAGWVELSVLHPSVGWIRAAAELDAANYKIADQAHINGAQFVAITGTIEPRPRVWAFLSVHKFEVTNGL